MLQILSAKVRGATTSPSRAPWVRILAGFIGGSVGIGLLALLTEFSEAQVLMAPFGASCVLLFALPEAPLAQPRNVIGGHLVATLIGLIAVHVLPSIAPAEMGIIVGAAIAAMQVTRTVHPPAGADPLVVIALGSATPWSFLLTPVFAGSVILVLVALVVNNIERDSHWPKYWL